MNIYEKLLAIEAELQTVAKNLNVETGKGRGYRAVSERDIIDAVKPLEAKYKVYSYPKSRRMLRDETYETENEYQGKVTKKTTFYKLIEVTYVFVNAEDPKDIVETTAYAEGIDSQDKGCGKAMTYADKYALMKIYKISTGDDPDQEASQEQSYKHVDKPVEQRKLIASLIGRDQIDALKLLIAETGSDTGQILDYYEVSTFGELTFAQWKQAMDILTKRKNAKDPGKNS